MSILDMSVMGSGAMDMSAPRWVPVRSRHPSERTRLPTDGQMHPHGSKHMWSTLAMETFEHSDEAKVYKKGLITQNIPVGFGGVYTHSRTLNRDL